MVTTFEGIKDFNKYKIFFYELKLFFIDDADEFFLLNQTDKNLFDYCSNLKAKSIGISF